MGLLTENKYRAPAFWNRITFLYASFGLLVYVISRWLLKTEIVPLLVFFSFARLTIGILPAAWIARRLHWGEPAIRYPIALALPYPVELAFTAYSRRWTWLPESAAMEISTPTAFLIFMCAFLFLSIPVTLWAINKSAAWPITEQLRTAGKLFFGLTAVAVMLSVPQISMAFLRNCVEPLALAGCCALAGYGQMKCKEPRP